MQRPVIASLMIVLGVSLMHAADMTVRVMPRPGTDATNRHYVSSRAPLQPVPLIKLPVGSIKPEGWLRKQLELQTSGFHGHLEEISEFLRRDKNAWLDQEGRGDHGWEEPPYWLKGFCNAAFVLGDKKLIEQSQVWLEGAIRSQKPDGWFGPDKDRSGVATDLKGRDDLWPNMIMLFCLQDYCEYTGDRRVIELMTKYFRYLHGVPEEKFLVGYWPKMRGGDLLFSVYWLYNRTGDAFLLELAHKVHRRTADWTGDVINWHNVNMSQGFGQPTTYYLQSKEAKYLQASYRNYDKIRTLYGQVPGGMFGGDENCRPGFTDPRQAIETCGIVEMMLSTERLVSITGDLIWADRCEDAAFNSLPAALTPDMKALRYLTSPNLVLSDRKNKSPGLQNGGPMLHMNPHDHRCCQHNWGHGWPYLAEHLWFATPDSGLAAVFYAENELQAKVGEEGTPITIEQSTRYPFEEHVMFSIEAAKPVRFPLYLRVPGWCDKVELKINQQAVAVTAQSDTFIQVDRQWRTGDTVDLLLNAKISLRTWAQNQNSVSVDRGPLTYSLKIGEKYMPHGGTKDWPAWEIHPTTPWNYGLVLDSQDPAAAFEVVRRPWPNSDMPFTQEGTPLELKTKGQRIPEWQADRMGLVGKLQPSPVKSAEPIETVTLIPMGAARLRISSFPVMGQGPEAHAWPAPPPPLPYKASASHCWGSDEVEALHDGLLPSRSGDGSIPRHTWWNHLGTSEWVQYDFEKPRKLSQVEVYWFDDTGVGQCRVPKSWRVVVREGDQWRPVKAAGDYGVSQDGFNKVTFESVTTAAVRLEVELQPQFSGGILEWRVE